jgi:hypothetical protein
MCCCGLARAILILISLVALGVVVQQRSGGAKPHAAGEGRHDWWRFFVCNELRRSYSVLFHSVDKRNIVDVKPNHKKSFWEGLCHCLYICMPDNDSEPSMTLFLIRAP